MKLTIADIFFFLSMAILLFFLAKEFIPDHIKKYWHYQWQTRKDHRAGRKRRWVWTFKR